MCFSFKGNRTLKNMLFIVIVVTLSHTPSKSYKEVHVPNLQKKCFPHKNTFNF